MNRKYLALLLVLALGVSMLAGCGTKSASAEGTKAEKISYDNIMRLGEVTEVDTCDGQMTTEYYDIPFMIFDRLVEATSVGEGKSEIIPGLAKSWRSLMTDWFTPSTCSKA